MGHGLFGAGHRERPSLPTRPRATRRSSPWRSTRRRAKKSGRWPWARFGANKGPQYPGTRSTPTVDGDFLYCLASDGELVCLETDKGKVKWQKHLRKDFDGKPGNWAYSESVLIDGDVLVCTPGGSKATLVALNKDSGAVIWKWAVPDDDNAEYASAMIVEAGKVKQYVQFLAGRRRHRRKDGQVPVALQSHGRSGGQHPDAGGARRPHLHRRLAHWRRPCRTESGRRGREGDRGLLRPQGRRRASVARCWWTSTCMVRRARRCSARLATSEVKWTDRSVGPAALSCADGGCTSAATTAATWR